MSYIIQNRSGGLLVCPLGSETLRLNNKEKSKPLSEITPYLENLSNKGYIKISKVSGSNNKVPEKKVVKEKGEVNNG